MSFATQKTTYIDRLMLFINKKLAPLMGEISENKTIQSIVRGMVGVVPVTFLGAIFLLLLILSNYWPALGTKISAILTGYFLTLGMLGFYISITVGINYARLYHLNQQTAVIICIMAYFTIIMTTDENAILPPLPGNLGSVGIFPALVVSLLAMRFFRFTTENNITIKMPVGVPPMIGDMFSALIPTIVVVLVTWFVRSILDFDLAIWLSTLLSPIFKAADNIFVATLRMIVGMLFWAVGLHGEAMLQGIIAPFQTTWQAANAAAFVAGQPLPYIWTQSFERMVLWVPSVWGLMFWMYQSKVKAHRALALASTPAALFTIIEPIIFGLPIAFNPYLTIPFVLSTTLATIVSFLGTQFGLFARFYVGLPWFTPPPILAVADSGGHWENLIMILINFGIGVLLYWPFFKAYEKKELEKEMMAEDRTQA
jgi:PTS system cellobiose-specific IIC component